MKCVMADWEIKNLGCNTLEFTVEKNDNIDDIKSQIDNLRKKNSVTYTVLKIPYNLADLNWMVQELGFRFIETQIDLKIKKETALKK